VRGQPGIDLREIGGVEDERARRLVVWPHHPDSLQRPAAGLVDPATQALTWNVFRTLELLPPAFWLRRLSAALGVSLSAPAPTTAAVRLWSALPAPPRAGWSGIGPIAADVVIESEQAIWALLACRRGDIPAAGADGQTDPVTLLASAASWHAGRRSCRVGVLAAGRSEAPLAAALTQRYHASRIALHLRMPSHGHDSSNIAGIGFTTWRQIVEILRDASHAAVIDPVEQQLAARTLRWCDEVMPGPR